MDVSEGTVEIEVPEARDGAAAGRGETVFYNPEQELNRDVTVATLRAYRERIGADSDGRGDESGGGSENGGGSNDRGGSDSGDRSPTYLDATAASGVRGVRAAASGWAATLCDRDPDAAALCRTNLVRNDLDGAVVTRDANALMAAERFDAVDLDPFGTPIPFADAAVRSARRLLCVTATDTAPLCGAHRASGIRKYGCVPVTTEFHPEMGLRVLLSALCRTAARYDRAARPLLSHVTRHYVRVYLELGGGASEANAVIDELGYVHWCQRCLFRAHEFGLIAHPSDACPNCGETLATAGPIYLGATRDRAFVERVRGAVSDDMGTAKRARKLLGTIANELDRPTHYDQHKLAKRWGRSASAMDDFLARLREAGYEASRTHYGGTTLKTTADVAAIEAATARE
ncbi:tRNA (guanine(10)-N(2))-dimethyltransferase [Halobacteriales archaeon QS_8_65_32]|nr:MAG: tRNA (guanine(10)-N(2))-dimethyltransferase [Halobacteriales archaeon QS_8_65_32]